MERSHGEVVRTAVVCSKLFFKVFKRIERMAGIEPFLILTVAALDLAVVSRCIGTNQLVANAQLGGGFLKQRGQIALAVRNGW